MKKDAKVIISGAGPVGLITALKLAKAGVDVLVLEADDAVSDAPRACIYFGATIAALDSLGLLEDVEKFAFKSTKFTRHVPEYGYAATLDNEKVDIGPYNYVLHFGQEKLAGVVLAHLLKIPNAEVRWKTRVTDVAQDPDGVNVTVEGSAGSETLRADWLVGADGARSTVRQLLRIEFAGHTWPDRFVATNVKCDMGSLGYSPGNFICDPRDWAIICIIDADGLWRITYGEDGELSEQLVVQRVRDRLRAFIPDGTDYELTAARPYSVHQRAATRLREGRVLLAGDAAHATNPLGGLGLTTGIWDAMILGDILVAVIDEAGSDDLLDRYSEERLRTFWDVTSPAASENKRSVQETDSDARKADMEQFKALTESTEMTAMALRFSYATIGDPVLKTSPWRKYLPPRNPRAADVAAEQA